MHLFTEGFLAVAGNGRYNAHVDGIQFPEGRTMRWCMTCFVGPLLVAGCNGSPTPTPPPATPAATTQPAAAPRLVGAWENRLQFSGGDLAAIKDWRFLYSFNQGGTMTESSDYDAAPPVPPAYGVWREVGPNKFEAKYVFYQTKPPKSLNEITAGQGWLPLSRGVLTEHIDLAADGNSYESTLTYEPFDMNDKPIKGGGAGKGHASRISF